MKCTEESQVEHTREAYQLHCGEWVILGMSGWSAGSTIVTVYVLNRQSKHSSRSLGSCKQSRELRVRTRVEAYAAPCEQNSKLSGKGN